MTTTELRVDKGDIAWAAIQAIESLLDNYQLTLTSDGEQQLWDTLWELGAIEVQRSR